MLVMAENIPAEIPEVSGSPLQAIGDFCTTLGKGIHYITHPIELLSLIWDGVVYISFFGCMIVCLGGVIVYLTGVEKGKKVAVGSAAIYVVIRMLSAGA
jgi:hypothetical protein